MPTAISPHFTDTHLTHPVDLELKIAIFADRVRGWQLDIAQNLEAVPHAGFGVLSIISSYFEMYAKYEAGFVGVGESRKHFKAGVRSVLDPHIEPQGSTVPDDILDALYEDLRCGMYHDGGTGPRIRISAEPGIPIIDAKGHQITIDPFQMVRVLQDHFSRYIARLCEASEAELRANFKKRFDSSA